MGGADPIKLALDAAKVTVVPSDDTHDALAVLTRAMLSDQLSRGTLKAELGKYILPGEFDTFYEVVTNAFRSGCAASLPDDDDSLFLDEIEPTSTGEVRVLDIQDSGRDLSSEEMRRKRREKFGAVGTARARADAGGARPTQERRPVEKRQRAQGAAPQQPAPQIRWQPQPAPPVSLLQRQPPPAARQLLPQSRFDPYVGGRQPAQPRRHGGREAGGDLSATRLHIQRPQQPQAGLMRQVVPQPPPVAGFRPQVVPQPRQADGLAAAQLLAALQLQSEAQRRHQEQQRQQQEWLQQQQAALTTQQRMLQQLLGALSQP